MIIASPASLPNAVESLQTQNRQIALSRRVGYFEFGSRLLPRRVIFRLR